MDHLWNFNVDINVIKHEAKDAFLVLGNEIKDGHNRIVFSIYIDAIVLTYNI